MMRISLLDSSDSCSLLDSSDSCKLGILCKSTCNHALLPLLLQNEIAKLLQMSRMAGKLQGFGPCVASKNVVMISAL